MSESCNKEEILSIIKKNYEENNIILDPHTATAVGASYKVKNNLPTVVLGTAHPYKFADTVKIAINCPIYAIHLKFT